MKGLAVIVFICLGLFVFNQAPVMAKNPKKQIVVGYNHRPPHMHHHMMPPPPSPRMVHHRNIYREHRFIDFGINYNYPYYPYTALPQHVLPNVQVHPYMYRSVPVQKTSGFSLTDLHFVPDFLANTQTSGFSFLTGTVFSAFPLSCENHDHTAWQRDIQPQRNNFPVAPILLLY